MSNFIFRQNSFNIKAFFVKILKRYILTATEWAVMKVWGGVALIEMSALSNAIWHRVFLAIFHCHSIAVGVWGHGSTLAFLWTRQPLQNLFSIFPHAEQLLIALIFHFFIPLLMRCNSPQFLFDPVIVIEGLDSIPKWAKKCVLLRLTSVGAENCRAYYYDLIHMFYYLFRFFFVPLFILLPLIFYSSTIVVKNIIATYVPMFLISYAYCFLSSYWLKQRSFSKLILRFTPCYQR